MTLSDIHTSIAYYLKHQAEVQEYLEERRREAKKVEERIRSEFPEAYRRPDLQDDSTGSGGTNP